LAILSKTSIARTRADGAHALAAGDGLEVLAHLAQVHHLVTAVGHDIGASEDETTSEVGG
jgi:hypothetical protein